MGGQSSQPDDSLSSKKKEWRKLEWSKENDLQYINTYQPHNSEIQYFRILLYGPTGSGKSSFINSVDAVLRGRTTSRALANAAPQESFTKTYTTFKIPKAEPGTFYPFAFTDIMGVDKGKKKGVVLEDIKQVMKGHVKDGYPFNTETSISKRDRDYNENPGLSDKVHVLVSVISVSQAKTLSDKYMKKMMDVRQAASQLGIPQMLLQTKIDEAFLEVKEDIKNVYKSSPLKEQMEKVSLSLGIPVYCSFPVKNYHSEIHTDDNTDTLILSTLRKMIDFGEDFVNSV